MAEDQQKNEQQPEAAAQQVQATEVVEAPAAEQEPPAEQEAPDQQEAQAEQEAPAENAQDEAAQDEAVEGEAPEANGANGEAGPVHRMLEEAVAAASEDIGYPTSDEADVQVDEAPEPSSAMSAEDLDRSQQTVGFTGEITGRVVTLAELGENGDEPEDATYAQFRQLVEQTSTNVREQEIVVGRVLTISGDDIVIDIGYKSDGIIDRGEFGDRELGPGDEVEVYLEYKENWDGQLVLSKTKADQVRRWQRVEEAYANEEIIEGTIIRRIKGGMIAELFDGLEAFLPGSQIDVRPVRDFDAYLEKRMEFKIVKLNPANENIVISHRALIQKELEEQRKKILSQLEVGQVLNGVVKNIVDFGVFIDLGGVDGLLHITDLSWGRVSHPSEVVDLDEDIQVVVLDYEEERQRISLGLKQLTPHPWDDISEKYDEDEVVEGKVVSITNYGAFVELEKGIEGLVHISEMSWTRHIKHPSQMVSLGQLVDVQVLNINEEERKISLGMKQLEPDPWTGISDRYPPGTVMRGTIRNITHFGAFIEIEPGIDGLVHISDLSWTKKIRHPKEVATKGEEMDVVILNIDEDRKRISLGHKQVSTNPWNQFAKAYAEGSDVTGEIQRVEEKGLVVELPLGVEAFVPGSELKHGPRGFQDYYQDGDDLELRVIRFDQNRKDIVLSEMAKEQASGRAERHAERQAKTRERQQREGSSRDYQRGQKRTTGPTTIGEFSDLSALKQQMEAAETDVEAPEPEAAGAPDEAPEGGTAQADTERTTPEEGEGDEIVTGAQASSDLEGQPGMENRGPVGKRQTEGGDAGSNTEPGAETAQRSEEAGDHPPAEGTQAAHKSPATPDEGAAEAAEAVVEDETPATGASGPTATTDSDRSAEEIEAFVEATGEEAVTTKQVKAADNEPEHTFPEGFPQTARLVKAGYTSIADLRAVDDFTEIDGIGEAYAEDISKALSELGQADQGEG